MKKKSGKSCVLPLSVLGEVFEYQQKLFMPKNLDLTTFLPIEEIHEQLTAERFAQIANGSDRVFDVMAVKGPSTLGFTIPKPERDADDIVQYISAPVVVNGNQVIYRHDLVQRARERREGIPVFLVNGKFPSRYVVPFQARYSAREARLAPAARMEVVRTLKNDVGLSFEDIQRLLVGPKGKKWGMKTIKALHDVAELYNRYTGRRCLNSNNQLEEHHLSNLLRFLEIPKIRKLMREDPRQEKHFVDMAVNTSEHGGGRVHDDLPAILKYADTTETLLKEGLAKARVELKAKHPEASKDQFPLADIESATGKLSIPNVQRFLDGQITNGGGQRFLAAVGEFVAYAGAINRRVRSNLVEALGQVDPKLVVDWVINYQLDELYDRLDERRQKAARIPARLDVKRAT